MVFAIQPGDYVLSASVTAAIPARGQEGFYSSFGMGTGLCPPAMRQLPSSLGLLPNVLYLTHNSWSEALPRWWASYGVV